MKIRFYILFILLLVSIGPSSGQTNEADNYIILYDEGHAQYFTSDMMSTALSSLSSALGIDIEIQKNFNAFNSTSLQGADLVFITNPGVVGPNNPITIEDGEQLALDHFISGGGSVFYMSNPFSHDKNITGLAKPLNDLIIQSSDFRVHSDGLDNDNVTVVIDEFNNDGNASHVYTDASNFNDLVFTTELNNLTDSQFLVYSSWIKVGLNPGLYGNFSRTAIPVNQDFRLTSDSIDAYAKWLGGEKYGDGRLIVTGSTIMFSDMIYQGNSAWINQESNLELFQNLVAWLLQITPLDTDPNIIDESIGFFVRNNVIIAIIAFILVLGVWFGNLIKKGNLSPQRILDYKIPKKVLTKKSGKAIKKTSKTKKKRDKRTRN